MIDFAMHPPDPFDFTFWAFPVDRWETVVPAYLKFCEDTAPQFRASLFTEVYLISKDDNAALSFCPDTDVFTLDMVDHRPRDPGWHELNRAFNKLAIKPEHGGRPLLNQTKHLTKNDLEKSLRERWKKFGELVTHDDPQGRFRNDFFDSLL